MEAVLKTDGPPLRLTVFARQHRIAEWQHRRLTPGASGVFTGKVGRFRDDWQLTNPQMVIFGEDDDPKAESAREMVASLKALFPIYRVTGTVETWDIQRVVSFALTVVDELPELLPEDLRKTYDVLDVATALRWIHAPDDWGQVGAARKRFRFEEALTTQLVLVRRRAAVRAQGARARAGGGGLLAAFDQRLPFELTQGQRDVGVQLEADLAEPHPMNRLLQGEVGSGKTVVALRAMLRVVDCGGQAALLAPTEVLAQQHHRSITAMLGDLAAGGMLGGADEGTTVALLTGSMNTAQRREALLRIASGEAGIVIGTHALLEEQVSFADLGLVVVDEQHRFGVEQRAALTDKAQAATARARDDRDPHPAHGRDDGLRRPRGLDAARAARRPGADPDQRGAAQGPAALAATGSGSGSARRSRRATRSTSSARASSATTSRRASRTSRT